MAVIRKRIFAVAASTTGVPNLTTDAVRVVGIPQLTFNYHEEGKRDDIIIPNLGRASGTTPAGLRGTTTLTMEVGGRHPSSPYSATIAPPVHAFLEAAGFAGVYSATPTPQWTYDTLDEFSPNVRLALYTNGNLFQMSNISCKPKIAAEAGRRGFWTFEVNGVIDSITVSAIGAHSAQNHIGGLFSATDVMFGPLLSSGGPLVLRKFEIDLGNVEAERPSAQHPVGFIGYTVVDRAPRISVEMEQVALGNWNPYVSRGTGYPDYGLIDGLRVARIGSATEQYNRVTVETAKIAMDNVQEGDNNGLALWTISGGIVFGTGVGGLRDVRFLFN